MTPHKLILDNISYSCNKHCFLQNIELDIATGKIITLIGENGAGKSTLLKIAYGGLKPTSGQVLIDKQALYTEPKLFNSDKHFYKYIGILPEKMPLYHSLTVKEYLTFVAQLRQMPKLEIRRQIEQILDSLQLTNRMDSRISTLSQGMQQCVGIAQAIIHRPKWLLLDEPFNGLDPAHLDMVIKLLYELKANTGILLTSHILPAITEISDEVLSLKDGLLSHAEPKDYKHEKFSKTIINNRKAEKNVSDTINKFNLTGNNSRYTSE